MKCIIMTPNNTDPKTGEVNTGYLDYSDIFSGKNVDSVLMDRRPRNRFRNCKAWTVERGMYVYLISYNTVVGMLDRHTGIFYDALRTEYGYTATSAQHISKFCRDYPVWSVVRYVYAA